MALPHYMYKDPCEVLEQKQEHEAKKGCHGCIHSYELEFVSGIEKGCNKGRRFGKRCQHYQETK